jgi:hypothetical protein
MEINPSLDKESIKKDKELYKKINRSKNIQMQLSSRRTITNPPLLKNPGSGVRYKYKRHSLPSDINNYSFENIDSIKVIDEIIASINELKSDIKFSQNKKWIINDELKNNLIKIRKELSKENLPNKEIKNILEHDIQNFVDILLEIIENISDDYLDLEILWILNNIIFFSSKFNIINLDTIKITNQISKFYLKVIKSPNDFKFSLLEKMHRIFGNLLFINNKSIYSLINNNIIVNIIESLIKPVSAFRLACFWLLNKILIALKANNDINNYINLFINKFAIYNYNSIFVRLKNLELDEISEFFWLLCELCKYDSDILVQIFFNGYQNYKNYYNIIKNFEFVLNNCMTNKLSQISFRLISNLLVISFSEINNEYLTTKFIENFFEKKNSVILYINDVLNSPINKYDISLVKDVLLLIFNLVCISAIKTGIYFKKGIVNLISDRDYHTNNDILKLLFIIFYKIIYCNSFNFESNDEKVIKACLMTMKNFKNDENILILFIDIFFFYLKATNTPIDEELKNELDFIQKERNVKIESYLNIFEKLSIIVKKASPLAKFLI